MKRQIFRCSVFILSAIVCINVYAAEDPTGPVIGKSYSNTLLRNITNYPKSQASIASFKGKWLIMDIWDKHCVSCIASFPKMDDLQKKMGDKIQVMLVAREDEEGDVRALFKKVKEQQKLSLPCAFDSVLVRSFGFNSFPQVLVIDPDGVARAWLSKITREDLEDIMSNKRKEVTRPERIPVDVNKPYLLDGNGGDDHVFLYRSVLAKWESNRPGGNYPDSLDRSVLQSDMIQFLGIPLEALYNLAYFGEVRPQDKFGDTALLFNNNPLLQLKDSTFFREERVKSKQKIYTYSLIMPKEGRTKERLMQSVQHDLENTFNLTARIEIRDFPYWAMVIVPGSGIDKLRTTGGKSETTGTGMWYMNTVFHNVSSTILMASIRQVASQEHRLMIDETRLPYNIDISMNCLLTNWDDVRKELQKNGLDLVRKAKAMKVLVISERK